METIYEKIEETVELGGTGVRQAGLHPDLKIEWHENMLSGITSGSRRSTCTASRRRRSSHRRVPGSRFAIPSCACATPDSCRFPAGAEILDDEVGGRIARLKCMTEEWITCIAGAHSWGCGTTATMMFGVRREHRKPRQPLPVVRIGRGNRRLHCLHPVELPAPQHGAGWPAWG